LSFDIIFLEFLFYFGIRDQARVGPATINMMTKLAKCSKKRSKKRIFLFPKLIIEEN
jgi:hypothetical protein